MAAVQGSAPLTRPSAPSSAASEPPANEPVVGIWRRTIPRGQVSCATIALIIGVCAGGPSLGRRKSRQRGGSSRERFATKRSVRSIGAGRAPCRGWDRQPRHVDRHEALAPAGAANDRIGLVPAAGQRRVNSIERQRDPCESAAVTDARTKQRPGPVAHPSLPAVATLRADGGELSSAGICRRIVALLDHAASAPQSAISRSTGRRNPAEAKNEPGNEQGDGHEGGSGCGAHGPVAPRRGPRAGRAAHLQKRSRSRDILGTWLEIRQICTSQKLPFTSYFSVPPVGLEPTTFGLKSLLYQLSYSGGSLHDRAPGQRG